jgi:ActR/RegA family two-component response regulator
MGQPVMLAVDSDQEILAAIERDLTRRFAADYRIVTADTPESGFAELDLADQVALIIAGQWLAGTTGVDLLTACHQLHPGAKRLILITYGDIVAGQAAVRAMALGQLDHYLNKSWVDPELELYPTVSELLSQRVRAVVAAGSQPEAVSIVGPRWSARSHELRDLLARNNVSHGFYDVAKPEGRRLLKAAGVSAGDHPIALLFDGRVLVDPPNEALAQALGVYGAAVTEAAALEGQRTFVVGGANSAGQAAVHLARFASQVTLLVRGPSLSTSMSAYLIDEIERATNISVWPNTTVIGIHGQGRLEAISVRDSATGREQSEPADGLFVLIGADPHSNWLADAVERDSEGFVLTGPDLRHWPLARPPLSLETSAPGVFAAGDVRHGSVKRVASAVGEGASAIQEVHHYLATS